MHMLNPSEHKFVRGGHRQITPPKLWDNRFLV